MFYDVIRMAAGEAQGNSIFMYLPIIVMLVAMFWMSSRSRKKQEAEAKEIRDSLEVGDEIVSIGGIVARVVKVEDATVLVESGADRSKFRLTKSAIGQNISAQERIDAKKAAAANEKAEKKKK